MIFAVNLIKTPYFIAANDSRFPSRPASLPSHRRTGLNGKLFRSWEISHARSHVAQAKTFFMKSSRVINLVGKLRTQKLKMPWKCFIVCFASGFCLVTWLMIYAIYATCAQKWFSERNLKKSREKKSHYIIACDTRYSVSFDILFQAWPSADSCCAGIDGWDGLSGCGSAAVCVETGLGGDEYFSAAALCLLSRVSENHRERCVQAMYVLGRTCLSTFISRIVFERSIIWV